MHKKTKLSVLIFSLVVVFSIPAYADGYYGIRALGMGGALRGAATGSSALLLNPAGMSLINSYVVGAEYEYRVRREGHVAHVSVIDSITSKNVAAGIYYNFFSSRPEVFSPIMQEKTKLNKQGHQTGLAISVPLGSHLILGANARYQYFKTITKVQDEEGELADHESDSVNTVGVDVGAMVRISEYFNVSLVGTNLIPTKSMDAPLQLNTGMAFIYGKYLLVDLDVVLDFDVPERKKMVNVHGGVEGFLGGQFAIRGGTFYKSYWDATYVTTGFGYVHPKIAVDLAFAQQVQGGIETQFGLAVRLFLN